MNALFGLIAWFLGLFSPHGHEATRHEAGLNPGISEEDTRGVHIISANPRTVVALEDTHFRPSR